MTADLNGAEFRDVRVRDLEMHNVVIRGAEMSDVDISGEVERFVINGVDVAPLVEAELNRRYPDRARMRPVDPAGFRTAWDIIERRWDETVARARTLPPERPQESVARTSPGAASPRRDP